MQEKTFNADLYLRISKEDGDKEESDSIANQRELLLDFVAANPDIKVHKIRIDDGYSGVHFNRPHFNEMIEDIQSGKVNCVVVKDFSRFGRNYIEAGKYIQVMFPRAGIRFIAVNDRYDSNRPGNGDSILVPFKNMVNDAYSADISTKVRSQLDVKRKRGEFIGSFAVYGYCKDPANKNHLIVDEYAAEVVRDIFRWKIDGLSNQGIADRLNNSGILSPMEYKRALGLRFATTFKVNHKAMWSPVAVNRILTNEIYTGVLEQNKRVTANYKVKRRVTLPKEEWVRVENAHEPVILSDVFSTTQAILARDTHVASGKEAVYPFCGLIICGDCGYSMVRKTNSRGAKKYHYYTCAKHREDKNACKTHLIGVDAFDTAVLHSVQAQIAAVLNLERALDFLSSLPYQQAGIRKLDAQIAKKREEIDRYESLRLSLYEDYRSELLNRKDYIDFRASYDTKIREAEDGIRLQQEEVEQLAAGNNGNCAWMERFKTRQNIDTIDRKTAVELIEEIRVYEGKRIEIRFRYQDEFDRISALLQYGEAV